MLAGSQQTDGLATGHLGTGFSWFPCVYKRILRWFPRLQVATACFSCSPPDLHFSYSYFIFMYTHYNHCHRVTAHLQLKIYFIILLYYIISYIILYHVISYIILYHVISYIILCHIIYHITSRHILYHIISCHVIYHNISCHIIYHIVSYHIAYYIMSYHISYYIVISYIMSYHISYYIMSYHISYYIMSYHHHDHISVKELCNLLTRSGLTYPEVPSKVCHDSFCQMGNSVSLPWVIYYGAFYLHVVCSFFCIPVICLKLVLFLIPLQFVRLFCNVSGFFP